MDWVVENGMGKNSGGWGGVWIRGVGVVYISEDGLVGMQGEDRSCSEETTFALRQSKIGLSQTTFALRQSEIGLRQNTVVVP
jgi:hypothetical protein